MVDVLGFDIGGANTKAALIHTEGDGAQTFSVAAQYFPMWKQPQRLSGVLAALKEQLNASQLDAVSVTMTAELSDAYQTKREGIHHVLSSVKTVFSDTPILVLNTDAELVPFESAEKNPLSVAAANWAATGWLVSQRVRECVVVDVGSTSTSIVPIVNGKVAALGKTDLDKLICGELVYTGSLRTSVAAIVQSIPLRGGVAAVSSELFALSGDVHLVLGNISAEQYTSETADGRGRTKTEALARLARVVCADTEMLTLQEIVGIAQYIYGVQVKQIIQGLNKVYTYAKERAHGKVPVVATGLGKEFLAKRAAEQLGVDEIVDLDEILPQQAVYATPAVGVALMATAKLVGAPVT